MTWCLCSHFTDTPSKKKFVLCKMPENWTTLPVYSSPQCTPRRDSVAVYTKGRKGSNLVYEGFICPPAAEELPMSALQRPPREDSFTKNYERLLGKITAEDMAVAQEKIIPKDENKSMAYSATSSAPGQGVVAKQPRTMPDHEDAAEAAATSESKTNHLNLSLQRMASDTDYPFPYEILDGRESLLPVPPEAGMDEFSSGFQPWCTVDTELWRLLCNPDPSEQPGLPRPADTYQTPDLG